MTHPPPSGGRPGGLPPTPTRKRDAKATRDRLVRAALDLFTSQGYHGTTTPVIAERAGVAEGTIYRHFTSKEQLLNEIYRAGVRLFTTALRDTSSGLPCRERLELIAKGWRDIAARNAPVVRLVFVTELRGLLDARSRDALKELREEIEKVIASGKGAGQVRPGAVEVWADVWLELIRLILQRVADKEWAPDHSAPQHVIDSAWVAIATPGAIAAPSPPPPPSATSPPGPAVSG